MRQEFKVRNKVLIYNSQLKLFSGKFRSRWLGPFERTKVFSYGVVEIAHLEKGSFKVNGAKLKPYIDGSFDRQETTIELQDLPHQN